MSDDESQGLPSKEKLRTVLAALGYRDDAGIPMQALPPQRQRSALAAVAIMSLIARLNNHTLTHDKLDSGDRYRMHTASAHHVLADDLQGILSVSVFMMAWARDLTTMSTAGAVDDMSPGPAIKSLLAAILELVQMYYDAFNDPEGIVLDGMLYTAADRDRYDRACQHLIEANRSLLTLGGADRPASPN